MPRAQASSPGESAIGYPMPDVSPEHPHREHHTNWAGYIYAYIYVYTYMHITTINVKRGYEVERDRGVYERLWREERRGRNDVIIYNLKKNL